MATEIFEFALRSTIHKDAIRGLIACCLQIPVENVLGEMAYLDLDQTEQINHAGLRVNFSTTRFQTLVNLSLASTISDRAMFALAKAASQQFQTEVAIGDFRELIG